MNNKCISLFKANHFIGPYDLLCLNALNYDIWPHTPNHNSIFHSPYDVIVTSEKEEAPADVEVKLHIRESEDSNVAALTSEQLADVFHEFDELIEKAFGYKVRVTQWGNVHV